MNSKEALKRIDKILESPITKARGGSYLDIEFIKSIKQDLDRLEKLKKAIEILKEKLDIKLEIYHNGGCTLNHKIISNLESICAVCDNKSCPFERGI